MLSLLHYLYIILNLAYILLFLVFPILEIHFLYSLTANAEKFLQSVQNQVAELGVKIQYCVSQEGADEAR